MSSPSLISRSFSRTAATSLLASVFAVSSFGAGANVLPNGGFENSATWNLGSNHAIVTTNPRSGTKSMRITSTGSNHSTFSDKVPANQGEEFVFNSHVRALNLVAEPNGPGDTPIALVRFRDGNNYVKNAHDKRTEGYRWAPYKQNVGTYPYTDNNMQIRFQMTQTGDAFDIGLRSWTHNTSGTTWWDDLTVTKLSFPNRGAMVATYQAEDANTVTKGFVDNFEKEFTGTGYVDVTGNGANILWNNVVGGGDRIISVRYSWEGFVRDIALKVNGTVVETRDAIPTGRRGMYATMDFEVNLPAGSNTIALEVGKGGGDLGQPMIDKFDLYVKAGGSGPLPPAAPGNTQASDNTFTDKVAVTWNAVSGADTYDVYRDTTTAGPGTLLGSVSSASFDDTTAVAGTTYQYRVQACNTAGCGSFGDWDAGTRDVANAGGGALSLVNGTAESNTDISDGASDFVSLGATEVRMANVDPQIFAVTGIGSTAGLTYTATKFGHQWQNGTPQLSGDNVKSGQRVFNNGKGLQFTAAAGQTSRSLSVWMTGKGKSTEDLAVTFTASLSDGSAADVSTTISQAGSTKVGRLVTLTYSAANDGELITVSLVKSGGNFISIDAISLTGGTGEPANQPPIIDPVDPLTITEGDTLHIDLIATDPEGMGITLTETNDLPGAALVFQDFGGGVGSIDWVSAEGDVGSYTITVTAEDADLLSSSTDIAVQVLPIGGLNGALSATSTPVADRNKTLSGSYIKYAPTTAITQATNSAGAQPFGPVVALGGALANRSPASFVRYFYSGATPSNGTRVRGGNRVFDPAPNGMEISIDADASPRSATVFVGVKDVTARLIMTMSDSSAEPVIIDIDRRGLGLSTFAIDLDFQAGSANQTVDVQLFVHEETTNSITGFAQFEAAEQ